MDLRSLVVTELSRLRDSVTTNSDYIFITCPWHGGGREKTPSLKVNLEQIGQFPPGTFHCFSCSESGGWNKLAQKLGLKQSNGVYFREDVSGVDTDLLKKKLLSFTKDKYDNNIEPWPKDREWRNIPGNIVNRMKGRLVTTSWGRERLFLPCFMFDEEVGGISCLLERPNKQTKAYFNTKGEWTHESWLFYDQINRLKSPVIAVTEGPRDALRLMSFGIPAVAAIGAATVLKSNEKINYLVSLAPKLLILAFDGDEAGERATRVVRKKVQPYLDTAKFKFEPGIDPGNVDSKYLRKMANKLRERYGNLMI